MADPQRRREGYNLVARLHGSGPLVASLGTGRLVRLRNTPPIRPVSPSRSLQKSRTLAGRDAAGGSFASIWCCGPKMCLGRAWPWGTACEHAGGEPWSCYIGGGPGTDVRHFVNALSRDTRRAYTQGVPGVRRAQGIQGAMLERSLLACVEAVHPASGPGK